MCGGVQFKHEGKTLKVYFPSPQAVLPVRLKSGVHMLLPWGRREGESGALPVGGWARHESILAGKWDRFFPKAVRLDLEAFMEKDNQGKSHWYPLVASDAVQGLTAQEEDEQRVYVVTITPTLPVQAAVHSRWPRIVSASRLQ